MSGRSARSIRNFSLELSQGLVLHGIRKSYFSTFDGKLESQCIRNGSQNPPFCPWSLQDTFIIYSSISHQHVFQTDFAKKQNLENRQSGNMNTVPAVRKDETLTRILRFWARKLGSELTPNGITWLQINF